MSLSLLALSTAQVLESNDALIYVSADVRGAGCGVVRCCLGANLLSTFSACPGIMVQHAMLKYVSQSHALEANGLINHAETTVKRWLGLGLGSVFMHESVLIPREWLSGDLLG